MLEMDFFSQPTLALARGLLGKHLVHLFNGHVLEAKIVEVEAYHQAGDTASHSYRGPSRRNRVMFGPSGHLYVYFIYGMHYCMNVVTEPSGTGAAVLIRAMEPVAGITVMRRQRARALEDRQLTNGPAKCCRALGIGLESNGRSLLGPDLFLREGPPLPNVVVQVATRIGISKSKQLPWRFYVRDNPYVSKK